MRTTRRALLIVLPVAATGTLARPADAASASKINREADEALRKLYATETKARDLSRRAKAILVFPKEPLNKLQFEDYLKLL